MRIKKEDLPEGWKHTKLKEVCLKTSNIKWPSTKGEGYHYIDLSAVSRESLLITETVQVDKNNAPSRAKKIIKTGDVIFATTRPTLKRAAIIPSNFDNQICSTGFTVLRPNSEKALSRYIFYSLLLEDFMTRMESLQRGASYPAVTDTDVKDYEIPLPSLSEQHRIVSILDTAFEAIDQAKANAEKNLENAKEMFESYLESVDAEKVSMGSFVTIKTGKLNANKAVENGKYPFFTCSRQIFSIDNYAFDHEAILLAGNNASGDFNVKHYSGKFNAYQRTYVITIDSIKEASYRYLYFQLLKSLKEFKRIAIGANTRFLKIGMIRDLKIALPSIKEQQRIVTTLDELLTETQQLQTLYQKKIAALDELKKSILQKAFRGELETE